LESEAHEAVTDILREWARDLSVCTEEELRERWQGPSREVLNKLDPLGFEGRLQFHNPIYFLAERVFFDNVIEDKTFLYAPLHRDQLCKFVLNYILFSTRADAGALILIQRDSLKSTFMHGVVPLWVSLRDKHLFNRDVRIILRHHKEERASDNLVRLMAKAVTSKFLKENWPEFCAESTKELGTMTEMRWPCAVLGQASEKSIIAKGLKASQTGAHFDYVFNDDLVTEDHIDSKTERDSAQGKYNASRYTLDMAKRREVNSGTRYHINDLWGKFIKAKKRNGDPMYQTLILGSGGNDTDDALSHPYRHTQEVLDQLREEEIARSGNDLLYHLQMQNNVKSAHVMVTSRDWLRWCNMDEVPEETWRAITIDPAWKGDKNWGEGCYGVIQAWAFQKVGSIIVQYLMDQVVSNQLTEKDAMDHTFRLAGRYAIFHVIPEQRGGKSLGTNIMDEGISRGWPMVILDPKTQQAAKDIRIGRFLGACQSRRVFIVKSCSYLDHFLAEYDDYPQCDYKDVLDAAGWTQDPVVSENYGPRLNSNRRFNPRRQPQSPPRTRHCAI